MNLVIKSKVVHNFDLNKQKADIVYLNSLKNKTQIFFFDGTQLEIYKVLKYFEVVLCVDHEFIRVHRSYIVNKKFVKSIDMKGGFLKLVDNIVIPLYSKGYQIFNSLFDNFIE